MIPFFDVEIDASFPENLSMGLPPEDEVDEEGYGYFHDVWAIGEVDRGEAVVIIEEERRIVDLIDRESTSCPEFEAMAKAVEEGNSAHLPKSFKEHRSDSELARLIEALDEEPAALDALEVGVAGLVYALNSVGCFTAASCRGHKADRPWSDFPVIFFAAERPTVLWLTPLVQESGCGFADGSGRGERLIVITAPSITNFMHLANSIVQRTS